MEKHKLKTRVVAEEKPEKQTGPLRALFEKGKEKYEKKQSINRQYAVFIFKGFAVLLRCSFDDVSIPREREEIMIGT